MKMKIGTIELGFYLYEVLGVNMDSAILAKAYLVEFEESVKDSLDDVGYELEYVRYSTDGMVYVRAYTYEGSGSWGVFKKALLSSIKEVW